MWDEHQRQHQRHQSRKTCSLVKTKFRRDKNWVKTAKNGHFSTKSGQTQTDDDATKPTLGEL